MADQELPPALASDERFSILCGLLQESLDGIDVNTMLVYLVDLMKPSILPHLADQLGNVQPIRAGVVIVACRSKRRGHSGLRNGVNGRRWRL